MSTEKTEPRPTLLARLARRPTPIFLGLAVGFVACCAAGRVAAQQQPYQNFVRFHPGRAPDSHYYPTFSQALNLARSKAVPGKTLVIIGGHSVMLGVGQRVTHVWTDELQKLLGDDYVVLNLAMRGAAPNEFAEVIAERLVADGVPIVYVTMATPALGWDVDWDGSPTYRYFFWDAWGKGLVPPDARRDAWLDGEFFTKHTKDQAALEARRRGRIDGVTYAQDLWNYVADRYRTTVWSSLMYPKFWRPHREQPDTDVGSTYPWELANNEKTVPTELARLRFAFEFPPGRELLRGEKYPEMAEQFAEFLPDVVRHRTLYLMRMEGRYYRKRLPPDELAEYEEFYRRAGDAVRQGGLNALVVGETYEDKDYFDRSHFSESGGRKLAADVAPAIRAIATERAAAKVATAGEKP